MHHPEFEIELADLINKHDVDGMTGIKAERLAAMICIALIDVTKG